MNKNKISKRNPLSTLLIIVLIAFLGIFLVNKFSSAPAKSFNIYGNSDNLEKLSVYGLSEEDVYKID